MTVFQMPFYYVQEETLEDKKKKWISEHANENKRITPDFEPIPGWKPLAEYGSTPFDILNNRVQAQDFTLIHTGDWIETTVDYTTYQFVFTEFNHYGKNEALMVSNRCIAGETVQYCDSTSGASWMQSNSARVLNEFGSSLENSGIHPREISLPYSDSQSSMEYVRVTVFSPSIIEACGVQDYIVESTSDYSQWKCFPSEASRVRDNTYWLRSSFKGYANYQPYVDLQGRKSSCSVTSSRGVLPCFCIGGGEMSKPVPPKPKPEPLPTTPHPDDDDDL